MSQHSHKLHIYFFPLMAPGHMIPLVDMARQIARHDTNVKATIVLPHLNTPQFRPTIERDLRQGSDINIRQVTFPTAQVGLPDDCVSLASLTSPHMHSQFDEAVQLVRVQAEQLVKEDRPDCIASDFFISWTADLAAELQIPRIIIHVTGFFPFCVHHGLIEHGPHKGPGSDSEMFVVPGLPDAVKMTRRQLPDFLRDEPDKSSNGIMENAKKAEGASYGAVFNTFKEMEPAYVEYYRRNIREKAWHVGPVSLCNKDTTDKVRRGDDEKTMMVIKEYCLDWLSTKEPNSVVYVCFGTMSLFSAAQMREIVIGLESCGWDFIWVVKSDKKNDEEWLPEGFEKRIRKKGLMIKSWAPQILILEHESVGGFLTHCGWNSVMEGVSAGKAMITWPISSEQFENEKLVTEVLKIGVGVGSVEWSDRLDVGRGLIRRGNIAEAVKRVMDVGEEGTVEMRNRVKVLSDKANKAFQKGGSSYNDLDSFLEELRLIKNGKIVVQHNKLRAWSHFQWLLILVALLLLLYKSVPGLNVLKEYFSLLY